MPRFSFFRPDGRAPSPDSSCMVGASSRWLGKASTSDTITDRALRA